MKVVWAIVTLLVLGGLIVLLQPSANDNPAKALERSTADAMAESAIRPATKPAEAPKVPEMKASETKASETKASDTKASDTRQPERPVTEIAALDPKTPESKTPEPTKPEPTKAEPTKATDPKPAPSVEPAKPDPSAIAAGQRFEPDIPPIAHAEILPSTFVKLADGSISADDAWTIRGKGTDEAPYEVSWEFLASAQDTYSPRLSENKIPARIAFLSGKKVRISGYLAFPLVAQTTGECLVMLNQWDGCCIGVPPTPYDAIEVKLSTEMKGWKKHTLNFGAIEGTFTVEPYLVENWLVGLYMLKNAAMNREL